MIEVYVESIRVNMTNRKRVVMLKEKAGARFLPIWIGHFEADAIAIPMQGVSVARPLTHDMVVAALGQLGATWAHGIISRLDNETFYALVVVKHAGRQVEIDCRPSDAISVAIRARVPIYVADEVMERAGMTFDPDAGPTDGPDGAPGAAAPYWPGAEPIGGPPPEPFEQLPAVTEPVLAALQWAIDEARRTRRASIGPGDLMLGVLQQGRAAAPRILADLSVERSELQRLVEEARTQDRYPALLLTPVADAITRRAIEEASRLEEATVGTEHLLLALAGDAGGSVPVALDQLGVSPDAIRRQIAVLLSTAPPRDDQGGEPPA